MEVEHGVDVDNFVIGDLERLDPVMVIFEGDIGYGKIIVECFGESWSSYFGSIGNRKLTEFIAGIDADYLGNRLISNTFHKPTQREEKYVCRISQAVIDACKLTNDTAKK